MRAFRLRSTLLPLCAALLLPIAACGDDSTPGTDTTDTVQPDTTDTVQPDTTDTVQPDTTDTTEPDTTDTTEPDTTDTTEPDTTDTTEPDTTQSSLATLVAPFAGSANNFETTPNASVVGLVVTLVKPDVGTELGGFFAIDPTDLTPVYFAPATGVAALPETLEETSIINVTISKMKNVSGMPMVTEYTGLTVTGEVESLDESFQDASTWAIADWTDTQASYIDLQGTIVGDSAASGGGGAWRRFGFTSTGLTEVNAQVNLRFPTEIVDYFAIEDGCVFDLIGGAVWAFRGAGATDVLQYQPMFFAPWSFLLFCTPPELTTAVTSNNTTVVLTFSRPMLEESFDTTSFTFDPPLEVLDFVFSNDLKTVTLTTAEHTAASYTVTIDAEVVDTTYEPINTDERTATFETGTVQPTLAVLYCFETDATTYSGTPTLVGSGFADVTDVTRVGGTINATIAGNGSKPAECTVTGNARSAQGPATWSAETAFSPSIASYYTFSFKAPAGRVSLKFDAHRSSTGPTKLAVWQSASSTAVSTDVDVPTAFSAYPMFPIAGSEYAFDIPDSTATAVEVRIYPYASGAGTFRIDNLTVLFTPAN